MNGDGFTMVVAGVVGLMIAMTAGFMFNVMSNGAREQDLRSKGLREIYVTEGNPDMRTLNESMEQKRPVKVAISRSDWDGRGLISNKYGMKSVLFVDDSTQSFGVVMGTDRITDRYYHTTDVTYNVEYVVMEGIVESKQVVGGYTAYQLRISSDLLQ